MNWCKIGWHDWVKVESKEFNQLVADEIRKLLPDAVVGTFITIPRHSYERKICALCGKEIDQISQVMPRVKAHAKLKVEKGGVRIMRSVDEAIELATNYKVPR